MTADIPCNGLLKTTDLLDLGFTAFLSLFLYRNQCEKNVWESGLDMPECRLMIRTSTCSEMHLLWLGAQQSTRRP